MIFSSLCCADRSRSRSGELTGFIPSWVKSYYTIARQSGSSSQAYAVAFFAQTAVTWSSVGDFTDVSPHSTTQNLIVCPKEASMLLSLWEELCRTRLPSVLQHCQNSAKPNFANFGSNCSMRIHRHKSADV